jgi:hypothetical protein
MRQNLVYVLILTIVVSGVGVGSMSRTPGHTSPECLLGSEVAPQCLAIFAGSNPSVGGKVTIDAVFTNTSNMTVNLSDYELQENVTDTIGKLVHQNFCAVLYEPAILAPGKTWECEDASWTLPAGTYYVHDYIYSISSQRVIASADARTTL